MENIARCELPVHIEEATVAGNPKTALALVIGQQFQETYEKILEKLLAWLGLTHLMRGVTLR
jgi:hypothetical protein